MYGDLDIISKAKEEFAYLDSSNESLSHLETIVNQLKEWEYRIFTSTWVIQGFKYHNGIVFSAYSDKAGYVLSKGGR